jgi:cell division protein ZapA
MAIVNVDVNGRSYQVGCDDGQEPHLLSLAKSFDGHVRQVADELGQVGELRLFLLGALMQADELADARARASEAQAALARLQGEHLNLERRATTALDTAARRIEALTLRAG